MEKFLSLAFLEQSKEDGLTVLCRGCGINTLMAKFIQFYCYGSETHHQSQVEEEEMGEPTPMRPQAFPAHAC